MATNLQRFKTDLENLLRRGDALHFVLQRDWGSQEVRRKLLDERVRKRISGAPVDEVPSFEDDYQAWYSEAKALIRQLLPDRLSDFVRHYEKPKSRKEISAENYRIEDLLQGIAVTRGPYSEQVAGPESALPHFRQQLAILSSVKARFESSLFDIRQLVQADLFDSELDSANELATQKFTRAAGAVAGVVLERHLRLVCDNHAIKVSKKAPGISDLNDLLKNAGTVDVPTWRFIQHLADIRNLCDHSKSVDPTVEQVNDLVAGVMKVTKTVF